MKFKVGDIVEIKNDHKKDIYRYYRIKNDILFKVVGILECRVKLLDTPGNMYYFSLSPENIRLFKQEEIREEDIL